MFNIIGCKAVFISTQNCYEEGIIKDVTLDEKAVRFTIKVEEHINDKINIIIYKNIHIGNLIELYKD